MAEGHTIETYGRGSYNRNIWPYNSQAAAPPLRLADFFVCFDSPSIPTTDQHLQFSPMRVNTHTVKPVMMMSAMRNLMLRALKRQIVTPQRSIDFFFETD